MASQDSPKTYYQIFGALMALTGLTVGAAYVPFPGVVSAIVAVAIACVKASLVIWVFMHVRHQSNLSKVFVFVGFCWLAMMIGLTLSDYLSRSWDSFPSRETWVTEAPKYLTPRKPPVHDVYSQAHERPAQASH